MTTSSYLPPVDQLLTLGEHPSVHRSQPQHWLNYPQQFGLTAAHRDDLLRMVNDPELEQSPTETAAVWAPLHAWRSLGQLGQSEVILPLFQGLTLDDDYRAEDFSGVCQQIGYGAIEPLIICLADRQADWLNRSLAVDALADVGQIDEAARYRCGLAIATQLELYQRQNPLLNASLISGLITLKSLEYLDLIEQAFAAKKVDLSISGDWQDVQAYLGLIPQSELQQRRHIEAHRPVVDFTIAATAPAQSTSGGQGFGAAAAGKKNRKKKKG